jgi:hypothetical protein
MMPQMDGVISPSGHSCMSRVKFCLSCCWHIMVIVIVLVVYLVVFLGFAQTVCCILMVQLNHAFSIFCSRML